MSLMERLFLLAFACLFPLTLSTAKGADWRIGFGKVEITPTEPVRLSGYATRDKGHSGVADPLYARACVLTDGENAGSTMILLSIDSIAVIAEMTRHISDQVMEKYSIPRSQLVVCSTHSHAAPHVAGGLSNLYRTPLTAEESAALERNNLRIEKGALDAIALALAARKKGTIQLGEGKADFAVNRRVLKAGVWSGFGVQADGPVDRRVRVLKAMSSDGQLLGAAFLYACHCTTLGPSFNEVSADWAGLSASELEQVHQGAVFVPVIGCGADANPEPRRNYDDAKAHASEMTKAIEAALPKATQSLQTFPTGHFGYAGLAPELPTRAELQAQTQDKDVVRQRWATTMLQVWDKMGRLPETYPAPIHTWQFGDDLTWVFLGGEVVVDYQIRLEQDIRSKNVWVAAYTDDVFAYVASERMRAEGGYEVDFSMLYYNQPGRWQTGTEDLIAKRVFEILNEKIAEDKPKTAIEATKSIRMPAGFSVDLMSSEPAVTDPVNIAFGHDGKLWVVEMSDYPLGSGQGGSVKWLSDTDGDGTFEKSVVFLDKLSYPTSVTPWRDGVIVIAAPDVFFAADRDGDGKADHRETLLTGVGESNPQHRASGFEMGLDGSLYFAAGDGTRELTSLRNGQKLNVAGRDVIWNPDSGQIRTASGHTQFVRARDEFGNWFGNVNNQPMFHYVIEDKYRGRGTASGQPMQHLLTPSEAPPVYPASRTVDRFNDLFTINRFTSACGSIVCRVPGLGDSMRGSALVCEPVHNLVARFHLEPALSSFRGTRFPEDVDVDWFASEDSWSRPVRAVNAPDGTIWIADMVRQVIEHPEWIPTAWQERLNVRSGAGLGRIYRVRQSVFQPKALPDLTKASDEQLIAWLSTNNGALRDLAEQQLIWRGTGPSTSKISKEGADGIRKLAQTSIDPAVRAQALGTLIGLGVSTQEDFAKGLRDSDARVRRWSIEACEAVLAEYEPLLSDLARISVTENDPAVRVQLALTLGGVKGVVPVNALERLAVHAASDRWLARALSLVESQHVGETLKGLLTSMKQIALEAGTGGIGEVEAAFAKLWQRAGEQDRAKLLGEVFAKSAGEVDQGLSTEQAILLSSIGAKSELEKALANDAQLKESVAKALSIARVQALNSQESNEKRIRAIRLLVLEDRSNESMLSDMKKLLAPNEPPVIHYAVLDLSRRLQQSEIPEALLQTWPMLTADVRSSLCAVLLDRRAWSGQLLAALEQGTIKTSDLDAATVQRLRSYGDRSFMARCEKVLGQPRNIDRAKLVTEYQSKLPAGDRLRGAELFVQHCAVCHRSKEGKPLVGPPLENLKSWSNAQWLTAILDPNRAIEPKYHQYTVLTTSGQTLVGLIEDRTATGLTLVAADGVRHQLALAEIESLKDLGTSLMPDGLEAKINAQGLSDLIEYAKSLSMESR